jgi:hypothetical protein
MADDKLAKVVDFGSVDLVAVQDAMADIAGETLSAFDLPRIKVPSSGATVWEVPSFEGTEAVKEIDCVILDIRKVRNYWSTGMDESDGTPPDCSSPDGKCGYGDPGGDCASCPHALFGSGKNNSQACSERRQLFLMLPGSGLPYMLSVPPSSIHALMREYIVPMTGKGKHYYAVRTKISLVKDKNAGGIEYSKCVFKFVEDLTPELADIMLQYRKTVQGMTLQQAPAAAAQAPVDVSAYVTPTAQVDVPTTSG